MMVLLTLMLGSYSLFLMAALWGWRRIKRKKIRRHAEKRVISVLVPFRNEEKGIHHLVHSLGQLAYPTENFEVILIDDHSEDNSYKVVKSLINDKATYQLIKLNENASGKKMAISHGVELAKGEIIAITDADSKAPPDWLTDINDAFSDDKLNMAFGGVRLGGGNSLFSSMQSIEFASLVGSMAASLGFGVFMMGNGANMSFRKAAFQFVNGYDGNLNIASGDDEFLARKILEAFPDSVGFINRPSAVVWARSMVKLKDFITQRIRWAGKWRYGSSNTSKLVALYILGVQLAVFGTLITLVFQSETSWLLISLIGLKIIFECWFLYSISSFLKSAWSWVAFLLLQFIYPLYVLGVGIMSQFKLYTWKGRRLSSKM